MDTAEYAPGRSVDLFGDPMQPTVLIWHGMQSDARTSVRLLAEHVAGHGLSVVVPDWDSHSDDGGRRDLMQSVRFAQQRDAHTGGLTLVGWSMGGLAAAGLTVHASRHDVRLRQTVCLAGAFGAPDPISGSRLAADLANSGPVSPFILLHRVADDVVSVYASRQFAADLKEHGWPVRLVEIDADHGSIAGARYDPLADRYSAADDAETRAVVVDVADRIAAGAA